MSTPIHILEFSSNLGLIEPAPGKAPGVCKLPEWLKQNGFYEVIQPQKITRVEPPGYSMNIDKDSDIRNADAIALYAKQQAEILKQVLRNKEFALVIGGDCSILIGNALALKQSGNYSLFFLDGHT